MREARLQQRLMLWPGFSLFWGGQIDAPEGKITMSHLTPGYTPEERLQRIERMLEFLIHRVHGIEWELESCGSVARDVLARDRGFRNSMDAWTGKTPEHKTYNRGQERAAQLRHQRWLYDLYAAGLPMIGRIYRTGEGE